MSPQTFLHDAVRVALLLGLGLAAMPFLRRAAAGARHRVLALTLGGALVLPLASALVPRWQVGAPSAVVALRDRVVKEPVEDAKPTLAAQGAALPPASEAGPVAPAGFPLRPGSLLAAIWACGALLVLGRLFVGLVRLRGLVRRSSATPVWQRAASGAALATGLDIPLRFTDELDAPAVAGVLSPVVLVPPASAAWSDERRFAVLLHEHAHVRQHDCLLHIVGQLVCALHWFNPLAWLVVQRLRLERELAADDAVVLGGARPTGYAEDLLQIADAAVRPVPQGALGMAAASQLAIRVGAIVAANRPRRSLGRRASVGVAGSFACGVLALACTSPTSSSTTKGTPKATGVRTAATTEAAPAKPTTLTGSTIDARLQRVADEELDGALRDAGAVTGTVLVLEPQTGKILAEAGRANGAPADVAAGVAYVTGSTLKAVTLAAALEEGVVRADERIDCEQGKYAYGGKTMEDYKAFGVLTVPEMLAVSTNVGFTKIFDRLGGARLDRWLRKFHFGTAPSIEGAVAGALPPSIEDKSFAGAVVAIGERMTASPLQMAAAYATIASGGEYVAPTRTVRSGVPSRERLITPETARSLVTILEGAVDGERATGAAAKVEGTKVAGKTGTAEWDREDGKKGIYASFVGFVPSAAPRFVILVGVEDPKDNGTGGKVAAPVFSRVARRALRPE